MIDIKDFNKALEDLRKKAQTPEQEMEIVTQLGEKAVSCNPKIL